MSELDTATAIAHAYHQALYRLDQAVLSELAHPDMTFEDPTADPDSFLLSRYETRDEFVAFLETSLVGTDALAQVEHSFESSGWVVMKAAR